MPGRNSKTTIVLLRGINVGGRTIVPMRKLVTCLESLGYEDVRTYLQSGNAVVSAPGKPTAAAADQISAAISAVCGVKPGVQLLTPAGFRAIARANPFPDAENDPSRLHVFFLSSAPSAPRIEDLETLRSPTERFRLTRKAFYLHAPDGIGRSKLAAAVERRLGVPATARNWRTVEKLREMAGT